MASEQVRSGQRECVRPSARTFRARRRGAAVLLALIGLVLAHGAVAHARGAASGGPTVVVLSGQTLWGLAQTDAPRGTDPRVWVFEVERLNDLHDGMIVAGQQLRLPG